jgi:hypothetical protein
MCRDCSKCTERPAWRAFKRTANLFFAILTLGLSVLISSVYRGNRRLCPVCHHPLTWHRYGPTGQFKD